MILLGNEEIYTMEQAANWLREAWKYEPYNIYYIPYDDSIELLSVHDENDIYLNTLEEVKMFCS